MFRRLSLAGILLILAMPSFAATEGGAIPVPLPLFPANNWWNTDVSNAPLDANSANFITFIGGASRGLHPDFGGDAGGGDVYGFPFIIVDGSQAKKTVTFTDFGDQSDGVNHVTGQSFPFYPIPDEAITMNGWVEGGQPGNIDQRADQDRHVLIVDQTNNTLYELYNVWYDGTNWEAASGAFFDMKTNNRRPDTWTSADAAGLAILPGLVRYDEVFGPDEIRHAFRVTVQSTNGYVFPASHEAGSASGALPMGARLRLKADKDISSFPASVQKIFRAFKKYGLIVADNGSNMYISGTYDVRWDNDVLNPAFGALKASDFEVVQRGWKPPISLVITMPSSVGTGNANDATVTAYDATYNVAAGYTGTIHFTSTDGAATLPLNYTFTGGDAGVHTFTGGVTMRTNGSQIITATDVADATINGSKGVTVSVFPSTPAGLTATAATTTHVAVSWSAASGATQYELVRKSSSSGYTTLITTSSTNYSDTSAVAGASYVYKVRAIDAAAHQSAFSTPDAATTIFFTDDPLIAATTPTKAVHVTELRQAVNAMRATAGLGAASFTDASLAGVAVKATHIQELRTALNQARTTLGISAITFTDPALTAGTSILRAAHIQELRGGVK
ncbi:MAG TPA: hypothetical protein VNN25_26015 [Thermoanaerobaculia bacterium]|nr:hypothetical protein [Thermoanaerobaculia bacterium]